MDYRINYTTPQFDYQNGKIREIKKGGLSYLPEVLGLRPLRVERAYFSHLTITPLAEGGGMDHHAGVATLIAHGPAARPENLREAG